MKITISRNKSLCDDSIQNDANHAKLLQRSHSVCFTTRESKEYGVSKKQNGEKSANPTSKSWLFANCLHNHEQICSNDVKIEVRQLPQKSIPLRYASCDVNGNRSLSKESKLKIAGTVSKTKQNERNYPKSLSKLKELKSQQLIDMKSQTVQQKSNQILKTKRCTDAVVSPSLSHTSSHKMLLDQSVRVPSPLRRNSNGKKMDLTISKKLNISQDKTIEKKHVEIEKNIFLQPQIYTGRSFNNRSFVESDAVRGVHDTKSHFRSSTNEFKIVDPLDELKSQNTECLKKKMVFSWAKSDKEDQMFDKLEVPMLSIKESNSEYLLNNKNPSQIHKSMAVLGNQTENISIKGSDVRIKESTVIMKGANAIFNISSSSLGKQLQKDGPKVNLSDSVIEHTQIADEDNPWYKMK